MKRFAMMVAAAVAAVAGAASYEPNFAPLRPVHGYFFPQLYVRMKINDDFEYPSAVRFNDIRAAYSEDSSKNMRLAVTHEATLSSMSMSEYINKYFEKKDDDNILDKWKIQHSSPKTKSDGMVATVELEEAVFENERWHVYLKILRTTEGFATIAGFSRAAAWPSYSAEIMSCVMSARLIRGDEMRFISPWSNYVAIGIDIDGDVFVPGLYVRDVRPESAGGVYARKTNGRKYLVNVGKSFLEEEPKEAATNVEPAVEREPEPVKVSDGKIHKLFGCEVGGLLTDYDNTRKLRNGGTKVRETMRFAEPFQVFGEIIKYYSPKGCRLYKVEIASPVYTDADEKKLNERLRLMAKAVAKKFSEELDMVWYLKGYIAKFKKECGQSLKIEVVNGYKIDKKTQTRKAGKRFLLVFEDKNVK